MKSLPRSFTHTLSRTKNPKHALILLVILALAYWLQPAEDDTIARGRYEGVCVSVLDGDTIDIRIDDGGRHRVRFLGMDCMETHNEEKMNEQARRLGRPVGEIRALGLRAKDRVEERLLKKRIVLIIPEETPLRDPHDRVLGYVEIDGADVGEWLVREGLAELRRDRHPRAGRYREAARGAGRD